MANESVNVNIGFKIKGSDEIRTLFKGPVKDADELANKMQKLASKSGTVGNQFASMAYRAIQALQKQEDQLGKNLARHYKTFEMMGTGAVGVGKSGRPGKVTERDIKISGTKALAKGTTKSVFELSKAISSEIIKQRTKAREAIRLSFAKIKDQTKADKGVLSSALRKINEAVARKLQWVQTKLDAGTLTKAGGARAVALSGLKLGAIKGQAGAHVGSRLGADRNISLFRVKVNEVLKSMSLAFDKAKVATDGNINKVIASQKAKTEAEIAKINVEMGMLKTAGSLTEEAYRMKINQLNQTKNMAKALLNAEVSTIRKQMRTGEAIANMMKKDGEALANKRKSMSENLISVVTKRINQEVRNEKKRMQKGNFLMRDSSFKHIERLNDYLKRMTLYIQRQMPGTEAEIEKFGESVNEFLQDAVADLEGMRDKSGMRQLGGMLGSRQGMMAITGVAGFQLSRLGDSVTSFINSTHFQGQIAGAFQSVLMTAMFTSWFYVFRELGNIAGQIGEIIAESLAEAFRLVGSMVAGLLKGLGDLAKAGAALSIIFGTAVFAGPWTVGLSIIAGAVLLTTQIIITALQELTTFIQNIVKSVFSIIGSLVKIGVMAIVATFKLFAGMLKKIFTSLFETLKLSFSGFIESVKKATLTLVKLTKASVEEFANLREGAARAFKETVGVVGQSIQKFQRLMLVLKSTFGLETTDVRSAVFDIVSSGFRDVAKAREISTASAQLAIAAESDLSTSVNAVITALQNFGPRGETVTSIVKQLAVATTLGRMTMSDFGDSMRSAMGMASRANLSFKETTLALAMLTRTFGRGSIQQATRYFNRFIEAIAMPRKRASNEIAKLGISFEGIGKKGHFVEDLITMVKRMESINLQDLRKVFTTIQSRRAWVGLTQDVKQFEGMLKLAGGSVNFLGEQFKVMIETPERIMKRLANSFRGLMALWGGAVWNQVASGLLNVAKTATTLIKALNYANIVKFFKAFTKWGAPIVNEIFRPLNNAFANFVSYLIRGRGLGNQFAKIFKSDFAKGLQKILLNIIGLFKGMVRAIIKYVSESKGINVVFKKLWGWIKKIYNYLSKNTWNVWVADGINAVNRMVAALKALFAGDFFVDLWKGFAKSMMKVFRATGNFIVSFFIALWNRIAIELEVAIGRAWANASVGIVKMLFTGKGGLLGIIMKAIEGVVGVATGKKSASEALGDMSKSMPLFGELTKFYKDIYNREKIRAKANKEMKKAYTTFADEMKKVGKGVANDFSKVFDKAIKDMKETYRTEKDVVTAEGVKDYVKGKKTERTVPPINMKNIEGVKELKILDRDIKDLNRQIELIELAFPDVTKNKDWQRKTDAVEKKEKRKRKILDIRKPKDVEQEIKVKEKSIEETKAVKDKAQKELDIYNEEIRIAEKLLNIKEMETKLEESISKYKRDEGGSLKEINNLKNKLKLLKQEKDTKGKTYSAKLHQEAKEGRVKAERFVERRNRKEMREEGEVIMLKGENEKTARKKIEKDAKKDKIQNYKSTIASMGKKDLEAEKEKQEARLATREPFTRARQPTLKRGVPDPWGDVTDEPQVRGTFGFVGSTKAKGAKGKLKAVKEEQKFRKEKGIKVEGVKAGGEEDMTDAEKNLMQVKDEKETLLRRQAELKKKLGGFTNISGSDAELARKQSIEKEMAQNQKKLATLGEDEKKLQAVKDKEDRNKLAEDADNAELAQREIQAKMLQQLYNINNGIALLKPKGNDNGGVGNNNKGGKLPKKVGAV